MCLELKRTLDLFIALLPTILSLWNFTFPCFLLKIGELGTSCLEEDVWADSNSTLHVCNAVGSSINTRHNCLDHASDRIVKQIARNNNILCSSEPMKHYVCDAYQQAKSHQLSYSSSTSVSKFPL
jgi:hypothetical protein